MLTWSTPEANAVYLEITKVAATELAATGFAAAARAAQILSDAACSSLTSPNHSACSPGCSTCCIVNVAILEPEAAAIAEYLRQTKTPSAIESLRQKIERLQQQTFGLDHLDRVIAACPCAFLDPSGCCSIHPSRPLLCRSISSTSADDCRQAMTLLAEGREHPITCHIAQREIYEAAFCGLANGMEQQGMDSSSHRLTDIILPYLTTPPN